MGPVPVLQGQGDLAQAGQHPPRLPLAGILWLMIEFVEGSPQAPFSPSCSSHQPEKNTAEDIPGHLCE